MEVTRTVAKSLVELSGLTRFQKLVLGSLMKMRKGRLIITLPNGQALSIGDTDEIQASIHIKNNDFLSVVRFTVTLVLVNPMLQEIGTLTRLPMSLSL
jgi:hypothetical protein